MTQDMQFKLECLQMSPLVWSTCSDSSLYTLREEAPFSSRCEVRNDLSYIEFSRHQIF